MIKQIFNSFGLFKFYKRNISVQAKKNLSSSAGFTLVELLVVISIIGFLTVSSVVVFNIVRLNSRDAVRVGNIATISRALAMYLNDSTLGYPQSTGECLNATAGVGLKLLTAKVMLSVPTDPLWPTAVPGTVVGGVASGASANFCYYYFSNAYNQYKISFFLESNSKSGNAGINTTIVQ